MAANDLLADRHRGGEVRVRRPDDGEVGREQEVGTRSRANTASYCGRDESASMALPGGGHLQTNYALVLAPPEWALVQAALQSVLYSSRGARPTVTSRSNSSPAFSSMRCGTVSSRPTSPTTDDRPTQSRPIVTQARAASVPSP